MRRKERALSGGYYGAMLVKVLLLAILAACASEQVATELPCTRNGAAR